MVIMTPDYYMRVLLIQTAHGLTPSSGGYKANISLLRQLRSYGHETAQICYGFKSEVDDFVRRAIDKGVDPKLTSTVTHIMDDLREIHELWIRIFTGEDGVQYIVIDREVFVRIFPVEELYDQTRDYLENRPVTSRFHSLMLTITSRILTFHPTHVIFNDPLTLKLTYEMCYGTPHWDGTPSWNLVIPVAYERTHGPKRSTFKRISVIHTAEQLPFGPYSGQILGHCISQIPEDQFLRSCDGIWTVSEALQAYAWEWGMLPTTHMVHSTMAYIDPNTGEMPTRRCNVDKYEVGMVNPCPHKGLDILLGLAERMPHVNFVVWTSWGSQPRHVKRMQEYENIRIEPTASNTDEIWSRIRLLIVPSVWFEAWGMVATEAQLRGIPVIASNAGGLVEAKASVPYTIPIDLISGQKDVNDDYVVPRQNLTKWIEVINELVHGLPSSYDIMSACTFNATRLWLDSIDEREAERWLLSMAQPVVTMRRPSRRAL